MKANLFEVCRVVRPIFRLRIKIFIFPRFIKQIASLKA